MGFLRPHQLEALQASAGRSSFAFFLPPGSGKTYILIEEIAQLFRRGQISTVVLVAPKILTIQWSRSFDEYFFDHHPQIPYYVHIYKSSQMEYFPIRGALNIYICSLESFSRSTSRIFLLLKDVLKQKDNILIAIDESSKIKNPGAARTKNLLRIFAYPTLSSAQVSSVSKYRRIMTGSPITESLLNLYSQFYFLDPFILGFKSFFAFKHVHCVQIKEYGPFGSYSKIVGYRHVDELTRTIAPFCYHRHAGEIEGLPDQIYEDIFVELLPAQRVVYKKLEKLALLDILREDGVESLPVSNIFDKMIKLFRVIQGHYQEGENPKIGAIQDLLEMKKGKFLIFCRFLDDVDNLIKVLIPYYRVAVIKGEMTSKERQDSIDNYRSGAVDHLILMQQIGSYGLDLPETDNVIFFSCNYSYDQRMQSEFRAVRLSSVNKVVIYFNLIAVDTVDEILYKILRNKEVLVRDILASLRGRLMQEQCQKAPVES